MFFNNKKKHIDFIIGGAQKAGTTAIDHYLRKHPDIGMADIKEVHFFDDDEKFNSNRVDYSEYHKHFIFNDKNKILGEVTPIYLYWEGCCERIKAYNSEIKLIFILRNPITRAFSHWNMEYDRKLDNLGFSEAIRQEKSRISDSPGNQHRVVSYIDRGKYANQIKRYKTHFSDDQLLFIKYEDYLLNQQESLNKVFRFLNVDASKFEFEHEVIHKREQHSVMGTEDKLYLLEQFRSDVLEVEELLGWDCSDWLK